MHTEIRDELYGRSVKPIDLRSQILNGLPVTERRVPLAGISTVILEGGGGAPIILLHGQGEFAAVWMRTFSDLVMTNRIIVPDLPGHGATGSGDGTLHFDRVLTWLDELIEQTCPSPPVLVGHLLGGAIALRYAIKHGDRLHGLVLVDTFGLGRFRPTLRFGLAMVRFVARPTEHSRDRLFHQCMVDLDRLRKEMNGKFELLEAYALDCARTPKLKNALRSLMPKFALPAIPSKDLAQIRIPVSLIWGRYDRQVKLRIAEDASVRYGWPLHIIEDAADDPAAEQPEAFLRAFHAAIDNSQ
jgi:pimeloyl-ACP methyl ester carboxylesterase